MFNPYRFFSPTSRVRHRPERDSFRITVHTDVDSGYGLRFLGRLDGDVQTFHGDLCAQNVRDHR